jgi:hypothetical protein
MVNRIFNHDPKGIFSGLVVVIHTMGGTAYRILILDGGTILGTHRGQPVFLRRVSYLSTKQPHGEVSSGENQYIYFTGPTNPRIHFHPSPTEDEDLDATSMVITPGLLKTEMTLVIDWNKLIA